MASKKMKLPALADEALFQHVLEKKQPSRRASGPHLCGCPRYRPVREQAARVDRPEAVRRGPGAEPHKH